MSTDSVPFFFTVGLFIGAIFMAVLLGVLVGGARGPVSDYRCTAGTVELLIESPDNSRTWVHTGVKCEADR